MADFDKLVENFFKESEKVVGSEQLTSLLQEEFKTLLEGKGVANFDENTIFESIDEPKRTYKFVNMELFPKVGKKYQTGETAQKDVIRYAEESKANNKELELKQINNPNVSAIIIVLKDLLDDTLHGFVKYFVTKMTKTGNLWTEGKFLEDTDLMLPSAAPKTAPKAAPAAPTAISGALSNKELEALPLKSLDLIGDVALRVVPDIKSTVLANTRNLVLQKKLPEVCLQHISQLMEAATTNAESPVLVGGARYLKAYNKYLGEILAPISLLTGWLSTGDREEAEKALLNAGSSTLKRRFTAKEQRASYNISITEKLKDSEVVHTLSNIQVLISSKAKKGAGGALINLTDELKKLEAKDTSKHSDFRQHFAAVDDILRINAEKSTSAYHVPIELGKYLGILSKKDGDLLKTMETGTRALTTDLFNKKYSFLPPRVSELMASVRAETQSSNYRPVNHILSALAKACADEVNNSDKYMFDEAIRDLLSNSSLVQINSNIKESGEDCQFTNFAVKYPPVFAGKIKLDIKSYTAGRIEGKFTFKID